MSSGEFVTLDKTVIEDYDTLAEIAKLEDIFLLPSEPESELALVTVPQARTSQTQATAEVVTPSTSSAIEEDVRFVPISVEQHRDPEYTISAASVNTWWETTDSTKFFKVMDNVREARASIKSETADDLISSVKHADFANEHQCQLFLNACGTYLMNHCNRLELIRCSNLP